ncbi:MAG: DUF262 domain-containing protein [Nitrososphaerota archaeon]|nr:DUF262 domain-containing protein [Nitrososphaerota archaeon]
MEGTTIERFFTGKSFRIPPYQRDYAWRPENVVELWDDIKESLDTSTTHYLGTFIIVKSGEDGRHDLVDGQQRLTTLTLLLKALIDALPESEQVRRIVNSERYLRDSAGVDRLTLLGANQEYFRGLLDGAMSVPQNAGQRRLRAAHEKVAQLSRELVRLDSQAATRWLEGIGKLNVLEFVEREEGNAIRIFSTVNDRGVPLTVTDKAKSLLIYYSSRFLSGKLDAELQRRFGRIFRAFDAIKESGRDLGIEFIKRDQFSEDTVVRYHFVATNTSYWSYKLTEEEVLNAFLKPSLKALVNGGSPDLAVLEGTIDNYSEDLAKFFEALATLLHRAQTEVRYYKMLAGIPLSATLYPLTVRLAMRCLLDSQLPGHPTMTFADALEVAAIRVFSWGTNPQKELSDLARTALTQPESDLSRNIKMSVASYAPDGHFSAWMNENVYETNGSIRYVLEEFDDYARNQQHLPAQSLFDIRRLASREPTIDHILAQSGAFNIQGRGFQDDQDFLNSKDCLGNLALVEKTINSSAQGKTPEQKANETSLYFASEYQSTKGFSASLSARAATGGLFGKREMQDRTQSLIQFCLMRWALW